VRSVFEAAVASTVTGDINRCGVADGERCRAPDITGLVISDIKSLTLGVADRIIGPRGELVFAAVGRPSVAAAFGRGLEAKARIGDDVDPGRRRRLARAQYRHIFLALRRKSSQSVEEFELGHPELGGPLGAAGRAFFEGAYRCGRFGDAIELFRYASLLRCKHYARGRDEQGPRIGSDEVRPKNEHPAGPAIDSGSRSRLTSAYQRLDRHLKVLHIRRFALVQNDQIDGELLHPPIFTALQELAGDVETLDVGDSQQHDWDLAENAQ
jgi:hypothetical protein